MKKTPNMDLCPPNTVTHMCTHTQEHVQTHTTCKRFYHHVDTRVTKATRGRRITHTNTLKPHIASFSLKGNNYAKAKSRCIPNKNLGRASES